MSGGPRSSPLQLLAFITVTAKQYLLSVKVTITRGLPRRQKMYRVALNISSPLYLDSRLTIVVSPVWVHLSTLIFRGVRWPMMGFVTFDNWRIQISCKVFSARRRTAQWSGIQ